MESTALFAAIAARLDNQASTDIVVVCQEYRWTINRLVLILSSGVLAQQCRKSEETIDLSRYEPSTIKALLDFCRNTQHYAPAEWSYEEEEKDSPAMQMSATAFHVQMLSLSYDLKMPNLAAASYDNLNELFLPQNFDLFEFCDATREFYGLALKNGLKTLSSENPFTTKICREREFFNSELLLNILHECPQFAIDILQTSNNNIRAELDRTANKDLKPGERRYLCPNNIKIEGDLHCDFSFIADLSKMANSPNKNRTSSHKRIKCPGCTQVFSTSTWEHHADLLDGEDVLNRLPAWPCSPHAEDFIEIAIQEYSSDGVPRDTIAAQFVKNPQFIEKLPELLLPFPQLAIDAAIIATETLFRAVQDRDMRGNKYVGPRLRCLDKKNCGFEFNAMVHRMWSKMKYMDWRDAQDAFARGDPDLVACPGCAEEHDRGEWEGSIADDEVSGRRRRRIQ